MAQQTPPVDITQFKNDVVSEITQSLQQNFDVLATQFKTGNDDTQNELELMKQRYDSLVKEYEDMLTQLGAMEQELSLVKDMNVWQFMKWKKEN